MFEAKVLKIIDGDTFEMNKYYKKIDIVRIEGIDTPEKGQPGYNEAKNKLIRLIDGKIVNIYPQAIDDYKRLVAEVHLDGRNIVSLIK